MIINLERNDRTPIYMQIRNQIMIKISNGNLPSGSRLPSERSLALELGVNRSTIVRAYEELAADGLVEAHVGRGTRVCTSLPSEPINEHSDEPPFAWQHLLNRSSHRMQDGTLAGILGMLSSDNLISFASGVPDPETYPLEECRLLCEQVLNTEWKSALDYSETNGMPVFRQALCSFLKDEGCSYSPENILVCSGSQQCLDILARTLIEPGDSVIVEEPTYIGALNAFRLSRARFLPIPVDREGMRTDILEQILKRQQAKFIYTMPTAQNPAACTLNPERRLHLIKLARQYHLPIVEDDAYGCLHYGPEPVPSLASLDRSGQVVYLGSASKMIFPGLRIGWIAGPEQLIKACALIKQVTDLHTSSFSQLLMAKLFQKKRLRDHLDGIRPLYKKKRDIMLNALTRCAVPGLKWHVPDGGLYIWAELPSPVKAADLLARTRRKGVVFMPGAPFFPNGGGEQFVRLAFSRHSHTEITRGIGIICAEIELMLAELVEHNIDYSSISNLHLV